MRTIELVIGFGGRELNPLEALDDPGDGLPWPMHIVATP